jgi:hypothetical protein
MTWPQFVDWLDLDQPEDYKDCGAYVVGELQETKGCRSKLGGPGCVTLHRNARAVVSRAVLALDADTASQSLVPDAAVELGCALAAYTTWSHTPEKPRWRLLAPLSRPVAPAEYDLIARAVMHDLGADQFDRGSAEPWRLMHRPSTQGGYEFQVVEGAPLDADRWLARAGELDLSARREPPAPETDASPAYADLDPEVQAHVDRYFRACRERELAKLAALPRPWVSGESYWDLGVFSVACNLQEFANSNWCNYTLDQAYQDVMENAPSDEAWGESEHEDKWESAEGTVGGKARPMPKLPNTPEEDFEPVAREPGEGQPVAADAEFVKAVAKAARSMRIHKAAREEVARDGLEDTPVPEPTNLAEFLAEPDEDARYRVDRLMPTGGRVVFAAPHKAGKTTTIGNLVRCLVDGGKFLGEFDVVPAARVVLLDNELDPRMIRSWLRDQSIVNADAVAVLSLRGRLSGFNILDPVVRAEWAEAIGAADLLVFDPLRPALDALGLSEDKDAGRFLVALDELMAEAGVQELVVVHHMGHSNERSRGDSRILDWPDALWKIVKEKAEDHGSARFFSAYGRDVSHPESRLAFDSENRHLSLAGGSRHESRASQTETDLLNYALDNPGSSLNALVQGVVGDTNAKRQGLRNLVAAGLLRVEVEGQKHAHYVADPGADFAEEAS